MRADGATKRPSVTWSIYSFSQREERDLRGYGSSVLYLVNNKIKVSTFNLKFKF